MAPPAWSPSACDPSEANRHRRPRTVTTGGGPITEPVLEPLELLTELVRIPSVTGDAGREGEVAEVLRSRLDRAGMTTEVLTSPAGRPSLVGRIEGPTDRPPLVLVSHSDVVPVEPDAWTHDPFGGEVHDGQLWGRGSLDMKGIAVAHVEAAVALAGGAAAPSREVIVVVVPDEEAGGGEGAGWLLEEHPDRAGFREGAPPPDALGEGGFGLADVVRRPILPIVVGEKAPVRVTARARGESGHGSLPPAEQAIRGLVRFVDSVSGSRTARLHPVVREQLDELAAAADGPQRRALRLLSGTAGAALVRAAAPAVRSLSPALGAVLADTVTPTHLDAGYAANVVPGGAEARFDARLLPDTDVEELLAWLRRVGRRHRVDVEVTSRDGGPVSPRGELFDVLHSVSAGLPDDPVPVVSLTPGVTDLRYWRRRGATAYGWMPLVLTRDQLAGFHGRDERVPVEGFRTAVDAVVSAVHLAATDGRPT
jgi:acetylornithine deacetylase/succinyl-diaminopimelate desuccinylase-like protein